MTSTYRYIEKGFPSPQSANTHEVSNRILSTVLTWLQEKKSPVYVMATANNIDSLPPELVRKGRFDEIFFIDLPTEEERAEIFKNELEELKLDSNDFDMSKLIEETKGYSGAEINALVAEANFQSAADGKPITNGYLVEEARNTTPLSVIRKDTLDGIRKWAKDNGVRKAN